MITAEVRQLLQIPEHQVKAAIHSGKMRPPAKNLAGQFMWTKADIEALRQALANDRRFGKRKPKAVAS